ncbi:hypothetical protein BRADI_2g55692v3 [Brachypodium distachyon]|uniref:Uncharacterized protein n=1 Tax=Brachypodium distachyon TaxID=15368 RepID=A0A0Q3IYE7_BRADI|nr:hypothetical protein BRADI_2g55692v3 [Brachypodium distachyon]
MIDWGRSLPSNSPEPDDGGHIFPDNEVNQLLQPPSLSRRFLLSLIRQFTPKWPSHPQRMEYPDQVSSVPKTAVYHQIMLRERDAVLRSAPCGR